MTQPNQSELRETILSILGIVDRTSGNRPEQIATLEQELNAYITANYTPKNVTSEKDYVTITSDKSGKLCNIPPEQDLTLDEAIRKFKAYCQGEAGYDELDFKSDLINWHVIKLNNAVWDLRNFLLEEGRQDLLMKYDKLEKENI